MISLDVYKFLNSALFSPEFYAVKDQCVKFVESLLQDGIPEFSVIPCIQPVIEYEKLIMHAYYMTTSSSVQIKKKYPYHVNSCVFIGLRLNAYTQL